jgi:hypothetical protein
MPRASLRSVLLIWRLHVPRLNTDHLPSCVQKGRRSKPLQFADWLAPIPGRQQIKHPGTDWRGFENAPIEQDRGRHQHLRASRCSHKSGKLLTCLQERDWDLSEGEIVVTVPASFDEVARSLTAEAAKAAGLGCETGADGALS